MESTFWQNRRVCVTGGTGFLGYHLVRLLAERGAEVRVLALPPRRPHPLLKRDDVDVVLGDVRDLRTVHRTLAGAEVVFHAAGVVAVWGQALERMQSVHEIGTRNVLRAAPRDARIVHTSSIVTLGASRTGREVFDESSVFNLARLKLPYVHTKRAAELLALQAAANGQDVVVVNPAFLVGPKDFDRSAMGRLCLRFWRGRLLMAPPGGLNLADVRDVAHGHLLAGQRGQPGRRYILGGSNHTLTSFLRHLAEAGGFRPRALPRWPRWALTAFAGLAEAWSWFTGKEPYPSFASVRLNRQHWYCRSDRAASELGYECRPLLASLRDAFAWYHSLGKVQLRAFNRWWMRPDPKAVQPRLRVQVGRAGISSSRRRSSADPAGIASAK